MEEEGADALLPKIGTVWRHLKTGGHYVIVGSAFNTILDVMDVIYKPLYKCEFEQFTRPLLGHPKAWMSEDNGHARFSQVAESLNAFKAMGDQVKPLA